MEQLRILKSNGNISVDKTKELLEGQSETTRGFGYKALQNKGFTYFPDVFSVDLKTGQVKCVAHMDGYRPKDNER